MKQAPHTKTRSQIAKKPHLSKHNRKYVEQFLEGIEQKRAQKPFAEIEVERILNDMQSADEQTRAKAVREICPCSMPWEVFEKLRKAAKSLRHDPSPLVRANAFHIEEGARMVASMEGEIEYLWEMDDEWTQEERTAKKHRKRNNRRDEPLMYPDWVEAT